MKVTPIEGTPFACVQMKDEEQSFVIVIGNSIASPKTFESIEEATEFIQEKSWDLLGTTIMMLCEKILEQRFIEIKDLLAAFKKTYDGNEEN